MRKRTFFNRLGRVADIKNKHAGGGSYEKPVIEWINGFNAPTNIYFIAEYRINGVGYGDHI